jgi:hypothetical protein
MMPHASVMSLAELETSEDARESYDRGVLVLADATKTRCDALTARMWALIGPAATLAVSTGNVFGDDVSGIPSDPDRGRGVALGPVRRSIQSTMMRVAQSAGRKSGIELAGSLPGLASLAAASLVLNMIAVLVPARAGTACSSATAVLHYTRANTAGRKAPAATHADGLPPGSATPLLQGGPMQ